MKVFDAMAGDGGQGIHDQAVIGIHIMDTVTGENMGHGYSHQ